MKTDYIITTIYLLSWLLWLIITMMIIIITIYNYHSYSSFLLWILLLFLLSLLLSILFLILFLFLFFLQLLLFILFTFLIIIIIVIILSKSRKNGWNKKLQPRWVFSCIKKKGSSKKRRNRINSWVVMCLAFRFYVLRSSCISWNDLGKLAIVCAKDNNNNDNDNINNNDIKSDNYDFFIR